jgi:hypothetical protein
LISIKGASCTKWVLYPVHEEGRCISAFATGYQEPNRYHTHPFCHGYLLF